MEASNVKAIREALEIAKRAICHHAKYICQSLAWENSTINANCGDILCAHRDLCDAKTAIQKALAAPPRNCDAFSKAEVLKVLEDRSFSKEDTIEWLYSIAAERKEENNGSLNGKE